MKLQKPILTIEKITINDFENEIFDHLVNCINSVETSHLVNNSGIANNIDEFKFNVGNIEMICIYDITDAYVEEDSDEGFYWKECGRDYNSIELFAFDSGSEVEFTINNKTKEEYQELIIEKLK